jgi:NitT/TauT family transport system permease protein
MPLCPEVYSQTGAFVFIGSFIMQDIFRLYQRSNRHSTAEAIRLPGWFHWRQHFEILLVPVVLTLFVILWEGIIRLGNYPTFILPSPGKVFTTFSRTVVDGTLWRHAQVTVSEVLIGLALGLITATILGYFLARKHVIERLLAPYIVASQSVPVVAIAPLLVIWFGSGRLSKVLICALIVFFPMLINTIVGVRSVDEDLRDLMRSLQASKWQMFYMLDVPAALPVLFGGLKVGVTLSVIGAVVGEFVGADRGLGFLINQARGLFNTPLVFVAIFALVAIALILYGLVTLLEVWLLRWRR